MVEYPINADCLYRNASSKQVYVTDLPILLGKCIHNRVCNGHDTYTVLIVGRWLARFVGENTMKDFCTELKTLIEAPEIAVLPGIFDGFSARMVEKNGFKAGYISGAGLSESHLGWADVGIMGLEDNLKFSSPLVSCCSLPLIADADTGYGNAINVRFAYQAFERIGVAGLMIEDQVWPKRCGHMVGKAVIEAEEMADKLRAAVDARENPNFVVMARTDAYATHNIDEAIRRLNLYAEAGADLLFADAVLTTDDIRTVIKHVDKPLAVNMGFGIRQRPTTALMSAKELEDLGVALVIFPRLLTAAAIMGMKHAISALQESLNTGTVVDRPDLCVSFEELNQLVGFNEIESMEKQFPRATGHVNASTGPQGNIDSQNQ